MSLSKAEMIEKTLDLVKSELGDITVRTLWEHPVFAYSHYNVIQDRDFTGGWNRFVLDLVAWARKYPRNAWINAGEVRKTNNRVPGDRWKPAMVDLFRPATAPKKDADGKVVLGADGKPQKVFIGRFNTYQVFNVAELQTDNYKLRPMPEPLTDAEFSAKAQSIVDRVKVRIEVAPECEIRPHYEPSTDTVRVHTKDYFKSERLYYFCMFHEIVHATGSPERLNRAKDNYAQEELIAHFGALILSLQCGLKTDDPEVREFFTSYLAGYAEKKVDSEVMEAISQAYKAVDYILK